jgi:hypothetical protein
MKLGLIFSNDWELFGDGSGDYFAVQHRPLEDLLNTFQKYGAQLTVMADVGQQWAHQKIAGKAQCARDIVEAWEAILKETIRRHHDVQLHLHPQWLNAEYKNDKWHVNLDNWAISSIPPDVMANTLREGKLYLERLLKPIDAFYECIAFRAGAYCMNPSSIVIRNLKQSGILCDTSITKWMKNLDFFNYEGAYSNFLPWFASDDDIQCKSDDTTGILEIPICSFRLIDAPILREFISPRLFYLLSFGIWLAENEKNWLLERSKTEFQKYRIRDRPFLMSKKIISGRWLLRKIISKTSIQLDYDILPASAFIRCIESIFENDSIRRNFDKDVVIPIMATGHVKRIHNSENVDHIVNEVKARFKDKIMFWTLHEAVNYWLGTKPML